MAYDIRVELERLVLSDVPKVSSLARGYLSAWDEGVVCSCSPGLMAFLEDPAVYATRHAFVYVSDD